MRPTIDDFAELLTISYNRLHTQNARVYLWAIWYVCLISTMVYYLATRGIHPGIGNLFAFGWLGVQTLVTLVFSFKRVAYRYQQWLFVWVCAVTLLLPIFFYIDSFAIYVALRMQSKALYILAALFLTGFAISICSILYAIKRVRNGHFRKQGKMLFNFKHPAVLPMLFLPVLIGILVIYLFLDFGEVYQVLGAVKLGDFKVLLSITFLLHCFTGYGWSEFFLMAYCKFRFTEFWNAHNYEPLTMSEVSSRFRKFIVVLKFSIFHPHLTMKSRAGWNIEPKARWWSSIIVYCVFTIVLFGCLMLLFYLMSLADEESFGENANRDYKSIMVASFVFVIPYYFLLWIVYRIKRDRYKYRYTHSNEPLTLREISRRIKMSIAVLKFSICHPYKTMKSRAGWEIEPKARWWSSIIVYCVFTGVLYALLVLVFFSLSLNDVEALSKFKSISGAIFLVLSALLVIPYYFLLWIVYRIRRKR